MCNKLTNCVDLLIVFKFSLLGPNLDFVSIILIASDCISHSVMHVVEVFEDRKLALLLNQSYSGTAVVGINITTTYGTNVVKVKEIPLRGISYCSSTSMKHEPFFTHRGI